MYRGGLFSIKAAMPSCLSRVGMTWKERTGVIQQLIWLETAWVSVKAEHSALLILICFMGDWARRSSTCWVKRKLQNDRVSTYPSITHPLYCHRRTNVDLEETDFSHYHHRGKKKKKINKNAWRSVNHDVPRRLCSWPLSPSAQRQDPGQQERRRVRCWLVELMRNIKPMKTVV